MQNRKNNIPKADSSTSRPAATNDKSSEAKLKSNLSKTGTTDKTGTKGVNSSAAGAQKAPGKRGRKGRVVDDDPFADLNYGWEADEFESSGRGGRGRSFNDEADDADDSYGGYGSSYDDDDDSRESFRRG